MKKTVIKCTSRADWGRIIQWAEEIKPNCTKRYQGELYPYYGFDSGGNFDCWTTPLSDYTVLELSDFIAYPVKKEMMVSDDKLDWAIRTVIGKTNDSGEKRFVDSDFHEWYYAKPTNPNQEKIEEINRQIAELTKQKEELCKTQ